MKHRNFIVSAPFVWRIKELLVRAASSAAAFSLALVAESPEDVADAATVYREVIRKRPKLFPALPESRRASKGLPKR